MSIARRPVRRLDVAVVGAGRLTAARGLGPWLARHAPAKARGEVTIKLVSDAEMARLNGTFRGKPYVTDVLSFPELGDIAIARGMAARQAREQGHSLGTEVRILALHGLLHLLGYDHERDQGRMQAVETRLRRRAGLPAGLVERSARISRTRSR